MTEISFNDALLSVSQPLANSDHEKALQALSTEIQYHQNHDGNNTYLQRAMVNVYDGSAASLHTLELDYENEQEHPGSMAREDVKKTVLADQAAIGWQGFGEDIAGGLSTMAMMASGKYGQLAAVATVTMNTMHPNDSLRQQALEGFAGIGSGWLGVNLYSKGLGMSKELPGSTLMLAMPQIEYLGQYSWPNEGYGKRPDLEKIYSAPIAKTSSSQFSSLRFQATPEWNQFEFLKK